MANTSTAPAAPSAVLIQNSVECERRGTSPRCTQKLESPMSWNAVTTASITLMMARTPNSAGVR